MSVDIEGWANLLPLGFYTIRFLKYYITYVPPRMFPYIQKPLMSGSLAWYLLLYAVHKLGDLERINLLEEKKQQRQNL